MEEEEGMAVQLDHVAVRLPRALRCKLWGQLRREVLEAWCSSQGSGSAFAGAGVTCGRMLVQEKAHVSVCLLLCSCGPADADFVNAETCRSRVRSSGAWQRYRWHTA